jgi:glutamate N-acetyltransferase/amino-acid N-acetyltransferase
VAEALKLKTEDVAVASTGVIGMRLPMVRVAAGISQAAANLQPGAGNEAAQAIMTTDTRPKEIAVKVDLDGRFITIGGMAKGSGMIHPNMATMLAFLTTDAEVDPAFLHQALTEATRLSFNMITVDGDTSTNDMVIILANGQAQNLRISGAGRDAIAFQQALNAVTQYLAKEIARDGEGATRLIEVRIEGAASFSDAQKAGRAIAGSSLVKSAVYGQDANWGRILAAAGYSGAEFDPEQTAIWLGEVLVAQQGTPVPFDEAEARQVLAADTVVITVALGAGNARAVAWGCDLTFDYIKINADYRS